MVIRLLRSWVEEVRATVRFKSGTVYPALRRLEKAGLVTSRWQKVAERQWRRYYEINEAGCQALSDKMTEWQDFYNAVNKLMDLDAESTEANL